MEKDRQILAINVDMSCNQVCESCERFFDCTAPEKQQVYLRGRMAKVKEAMAGIRHKVAIMAGKGGVGKSTVTANLAAALAKRGRKVTILDQDFDGPSIPRLVGVIGKRMVLLPEGIKPVEGQLGIQVVSTGSILADEEVLTWFHAMRRNATEEFLAHVVYGQRDYLLIDMPPGTSSDAVNLLQFIPNISGVIMVTVPSELSQGVVRKAILLCRKANVRIIGIVENMRGFVCPCCGYRVDILKAGAGESLAAEYDIPFLGAVPIEPQVCEAGDSGTLLNSGTAIKVFDEIAGRLETALGETAAKC